MRFLNRSGRTLVPLAECEARRIHKSEENFMKRKFGLAVASVVALSALFFSTKTFAAEITFKKKIGKTLEAEVVEITDKDLKIQSIYPLDSIKTVNDIFNINQSRIKELAKLAHGYMEQQNYAGAFEILKKIEELGPPDKQVVADLTESLNRLKRYPEALPYALRGVEMAPRDGDAWRRLGDAYRHDKEREKKRWRRMKRRSSSKAQLQLISLTWGLPTNVIRNTIRAFPIWKKR